MGQAAAHQRQLDLIKQQDMMAEREHQRHLKRLEMQLELENARAVSSSATEVSISRNWRSKGLRGIRSLRNSMFIENVWTHSENCS